MFFQKNEVFSLQNFEGSLEFLLSLVHRDEIAVQDIVLRELTRQFLDRLHNREDSQIDTGAEFIGNTAHLLWLKSKSLVPDLAPDEPAPYEEEEDPNFDIIYKLLDYCRFKDAAKELTKRQEEQSARFFRGVADMPDRKKPAGIDHISLDELAVLFRNMMSRTAVMNPKIEEENWRLSDKIRIIRLLLKEKSEVPIGLLFRPDRSRIEWIVIFLAILELMKNGEAGVGRNTETGEILLFAKKEICAHETGH